MSYSTVEERVDTLEKLVTLFVAESREWRREAMEMSREANTRMDRFEQVLQEQNQEAREQNREANARMDRFEQDMREQNHEADTRMDRFEQVLQEQNQEARKQSREANTRMDRFEQELREQSREANARMDRFEQELREQNREANTRMDRFEQDMREQYRQANGRMDRFEQDMRASKKELNKKWGDLANKMGTIIEDILAPNLRRLASEHFQFSVIRQFAMRCTRRIKNIQAETEFDTLVVGDEAVILGEAKSSPTLDSARDFAQKVAEFFEFFPEYQGKRLIPVLGSWSMSDAVVAELTRLRIYAMSMGEDTMELVNATALETGNGV